MAMMFQPWLPLYLFLAFLISAVPLAHCQYGSPLNIETFYPFPTLPPAPPQNSAADPPIVPSLPPAKQPQLPSPEPTLQEEAPAGSSTTGKIVKAVAATAASTVVVSALLFLLIQRLGARRRAGQSVAGSGEGRPAEPRNEFARFDGDLKGFVVDENGLDVLYWRKLEGKTSKKSFRKELLHQEQEQEKEPIQEVPLLRGKSSTSHVKVVPEVDDRKRTSPAPVIKDVERPETLTSPSNPPPPPSPPPTPPSRAPTPFTFFAVSGTESPAPQPPPPSPERKTATPPPPPPIPVKKPSAPPPPPPISGGKTSAPPPPPPKIGGLGSSLKPSPGPPKGGPGNKKPGESSSETEKGQVKLKPLHWDKVNTNTDHSMVWDKIDGGSFRFDGDLMEHLFGCVATSRKSPQKNSAEGNNNSVDQSNQNSNLPGRTCILDPRKSHNIAIVLKSLAISRRGIVDALIEGQGLDTDTLEKLARIAPTKEEQSQILEYKGDLTRLTDAESFLHHLLKAVPSAFTRLDAILFRSNYDVEILILKGSIQTLELGCKELRTRGLFMKLLEATLKAGNRMNEGTNRGNAQAFDLNALRKLSDVKSIDGRTTLLHFVVEEVVRSEGKRCAMNRNASLSRSSSRSSSGSSSAGSLTAKEEREKEYKLLGLPLVGGLSTEFSNVKKAATIDYNSFAAMNSDLTARVAEIAALVSQCDNNRGEGFVREMKDFLETAEKELKVLKEEQTRVMELVKKTTEYYKAGASKEKGAPPLQLFVIVKDFLGMVDQVCVEISRNLQRKRAKTSLGSSSPQPPSPRGPIRFPNLPENFMSDKSRSSSCTSDDF